MAASRTNKIGLALGSGAARGLSHIGVLRVLEEEGIPIDVISGTSMGAFIGALYAAGVSTRHMEEVALSLDWRRLASFFAPIFPAAGLTDGRKVAQFMSELLPARSFEDLRIPFAVTTTDIATGETVVIKKGDLILSLQAAIAFPGIFTPVLFGDRFLVDGGLCHPVPVDQNRELGADVVIGVCAIPEVQKPATEAFVPLTETKRKTPLPDRFTPQAITQLLQDLLARKNGQKAPPESPASSDRRPPSLFKVCAQSVAIMENQINSLRLEQNKIDVLIRPNLNGITLLEFHRADEIIKAGAEEARRCLKKLRTLL